MSCCQTSDIKYIHQVHHNLPLAVQIFVILQAISQFLMEESSERSTEARTFGELQQLLFLYGLSNSRTINLHPTREWYVLPRSTHWACRLFNSNEFLDAQFEQSFRLSRISFYRLLERLRPFIEKQSTRFRDPVPADRRLGIFLYHIAQGATYTVLSNQFAVGRSTVSNIIGEVGLSICRHLSRAYIHFLTTDEALVTAAFWEKQVQIPGIVACIDGSHIPIKRPRHDGEGYFNRKHFYSLNVQGMEMGILFDLLMISGSRPSKAICRFDSRLAGVCCRWSHLENI
jgi:hypothetical protein